MGVSDTVVSSADGNCLLSVVVVKPAPGPNSKMHEGDWFGSFAIRDNNEDFLEFEFTSPPIPQRLDFSGRCEKLSSGPYDLAYACELYCTKPDATASSTPSR